MKQIPESIDDTIVDFIQKNERVTIPMLRKFCMQEGMGTDGPFAMQIRPKVILWSGMSRAFIETIQRLLDGKCIFMWPSSPPENMRQGGVQAITAINYLPESAPDWRWFPICFMTEPMGDNYDTQDLSFDMEATPIWK